MLQTQALDHPPASVKCTCGHKMRQHVIGICTVASCACVREEDPAVAAAWPTCQRCDLRNRPARYRVKTDLMNILICQWCAEVAQRMGLPVEKNSVP